MLEIIEKKNTYLVIAGMQTCATIMQVSMEDPHKTETRTMFMKLGEMAQ